nr:RecName: Full=Unknown protein CP 46 from 2D-PAGE [Clostridium pasteurianum]
MIFNDLIGNNNIGD